MTILEMRNTLIRMLHEAARRPVILSDQTQPEPMRPDGSADYPFIVYAATTPYSSQNTAGDRRLFSDGDGLIDLSRENASATYSFTIYSANREDGGCAVSGDDEALELAERVAGWFRHSGYAALSSAGIVVVEVMNFGSRSVLEIDETSRQYGFDVRLRFARADIRREPCINTVQIQKRSD